MNVIVETGKKIVLGSQAFLLEEDRELAWAENHVVRNPAYRWIVGNFVEADRANDNGHIFPLQDLEQHKDSVKFSPLNMLHRAHYIVGAFAASEMIYPLQAESPHSATAATDVQNPYMEALAAFYRYYFPDEAQLIEKAHAEGALYYSMEAVPESLRCTTCEREFAYDGRQSPTYCADLQQPGAKKVLIHPHFTGGALILPPARPAWKRADINELSALITRYEQEAEMAYENVKKELPHLGPNEWEIMMAQVMMQAHAEREGESARAFSTDERQKLAKSGAALPDGSYPIVTPQDLANAIRAFGRANPGDRERVRSHIVKRAKALGKEDMLPSGWNG